MGNFNIRFNDFKAAMGLFNLHYLALNGLTEVDVRVRLWREDTTEFQRQRKIFIK